MFFKTIFRIKQTKSSQKLFKRKKLNVNANARTQAHILCGSVVVRVFVDVRNNLCNKNVLFKNLRLQPIPCRTYHNCHTHLSITFEAFSLLFVHEKIEFTSTRTHRRTARLSPTRIPRMQLAGVCCLLRHNYCSYCNCKLIVSLA